MPKLNPPQLLPRTRLPPPAMKGELRRLPKLPPPARVPLKLMRLRRQVVTDAVRLAPNAQQLPLLPLLPRPPVLKRATVKQKE